MANENIQHGRVTDEDRREFLKALGIGSAVAASGVTLNEARNALGGTASGDELASIGEAVRADMAGNLNAGLIAEQQGAFADAVTSLPAALEGGLPAESPGTEFGAVAEAGWPVYDHLAEAGFFESTSQHLPTFTPALLTESVETFVASEPLAEPLAELGLTEQAGVDLVVPTVNQAEKLSYFHWLASEGIPAGHEINDVLPPITERVTGGTLLWLQNLDAHLFQKQILITEEMLQDGLWDVQGMAAGFHVLSEGAKALAEDSGRFSNAELGSLLVTAIALEEIGQRLLPVDMHWITEDMRSPGNAEITGIKLR